MDKYEGINKVTVAVAPSEELRHRKKRSIPFKRFLIRTAIAIFFGISVFSLKILPVPNADFLMQSIRDIVKFDALEQIQDVVYNSTLSNSVDRPIAYTVREKNFQSDKADTQTQKYLVNTAHFSAFNIAANEFGFVQAGLSFD